MRLSKIFENKKNCIIILAIIIFSQLLYTTLVFAFEKEGMHSDETWSYGLANSYYQPFIYIKDDVFIDDATPDDYINDNQWLDSSVLNDYVSVQKGERFSYGSVYHNQTLDHHPPLYYFLLHTICSFFPDSFSVWYGFFLNCVFLIITQIFLYKLCKLIFHDKKYAPIICCLLYAICLGAVSTFIFIRMYSLLTTLTVMHLYFQFKLLKSESFDIKKNILPVIITGFLGFMTQYMFAVVIGVTTFLICIWLLCQKKFKKMLVYGLIMTAVLGLFILCYPAAIHQITGGGSSQGFENKPFDFQFRRILSYCTSLTVGFFISVYKSSLPAYIFAVLVIIIAICIPLCFLFRNETWFKRAKDFSVSKLKSIKPKAILKSINYPLIIIFCIIVCYAFVCAKTIDVLGMGAYARRYIMPMYPLTCAAVIIICEFVLRHIPVVKKAAPVVLICAAVLGAGLSNIRNENAFLNTQPEGSKPLMQELNGKNCEVILQSNWLITCYCSLLNNCDKVKFVSEETLDTQESDEIGSLDDVGEFYLIVPSINKSDTEESTSNSNIIVNDGVDLNNEDTMTEEEIIEKFSKMDGIHNIEEQYSIMVQGGYCTLYKIT